MRTTSSTDVFQVYANVYDALYRDKDYELECDFLEDLFRRFGEGDIRRILDMGCGTGGHSIPLAKRGYEVFGIDRSKQMLEIARDKARDAGLSGKVQFESSNIQTFKLQMKFDVVICMFAVLSYQISNDELFSTIRSARDHVERGGLLICDFWYGPAVLKQRPEERIKIVQDGQDRILRIVKPDTNTLENMVNVHYHIIRLRENQLLEETHEKHAMRYYSKPEVDFFLARSGFRLERFFPFANLDKKASDDSWNVMAISRAI